MSPIPTAWLSPPPNGACWFITGRFILRPIRERPGHRESSRNWISVASSADGGKLVAVVNNGQIYTSNPNTTLGTAGYLLGGQSTAIELQYIGNGQFLPISHEGTITGF